MTVENRPLQERLNDLHKFRRQHEELRNVITRVLPVAGGTESHAIKEINAAFEEVKDVDPLNLSKGTTGERVLCSCSNALRNCCLSFSLCTQMPV